MDKKRLQLVVGVVVGLVFLICVIPLFLSDKLELERSISISANLSKTFTLVSDLNQFPRWNPWIDLEPMTKYRIMGTGVGSTYEWEGEKTGKGLMTMTQVEEGRRAVIHMNFEKPMKAEADTEWIFEVEGPDQTRVAWRFQQPLAFFHRYFGSSIEKMLGQDFDRGLVKLKAELERK